VQDDRFALRPRQGPKGSDDLALLVVPFDAGIRWNRPEHETAGSAPATYRQVVRDSTDPALRIVESADVGPSSPGPDVGLLHVVDDLDRVAGQCRDLHREAVAGSQVEIVELAGIDIVHPSPPHQDTLEPGVRLQGRVEKMDGTGSRYRCMTNLTRPW
jgi:hypothetical protein